MFNLLHVIKLRYRAVVTTLFGGLAQAIRLFAHAMKTGLIGGALQKPFNIAPLLPIAQFAELSE